MYLVPSQGTPPHHRGTPLTMFNSSSYRAVYRIFFDVPYPVHAKLRRTDSVEKTTRKSPTTAKNRQKVEASSPRLRHLRHRTLTKMKTRRKQCTFLDWHHPSIAMVWRFPSPTTRFPHCGVHEYANGIILGIRQCFDMERIRTLVPLASHREV